MAQSHILLNFLVIITMVFIASANDGGYKILSYGEDFPAYPWQRIDHRERVQHVQRRGDDDDVDETQWGARIFPTLGVWPIDEKEWRENKTKRKSNFDENFERGFGVKVIYERVPVSVILLTSYEKPKN